MSKGGIEMACVEVMFSEDYKTGDYRAIAGIPICICEDDYKRVQDKYGRDFVKKIEAKKVKAVKKSPVE